MRTLFLAIISIFLLTSCGSSKTAYKKPASNKTDRIIQQAQAFAGTRYKFGGTTSRGMDCSGLIYVAFQKEQIVLPRVSRDMATKGKRVKQSKVEKGDLVFFRTNKSSRRINHVGLVTAVNDGQIYFIHATTSKGVLTSSLDERYWRNAFVQARRVI
ncbi:NlpC/P60 family protein [Dokdonia sinensis]|uniref:NlpC/P60 family protein n=1 Tax=Dokdonia sinensis TaxID=2479847 RepID=A0A3M0GHF4_9FLAO|nr:C40 family peptidase [Dokdonia sinensis]RMB56766.1 NlpC/P60 family protein [Dokdonia sinensis]